MAIKFAVNFDQKKGNYLLATEHIYAGEIIFEEQPLVCSQYLWNAECKYDACQFCMAPLETAEENVSRLTKQSNINLPYVEQCCQTNKFKHVICSGCHKERYCSKECRHQAYESHHKSLCPSQSSNQDLAINLDKLCDLWKSIHYPPETASIMLLVKILAHIKQNRMSIEKFQKFSCNTVEKSEKFIHKLCGDKFREQIIILKQLVSAIFQDEAMEPFLTEDGFKSLLALIGKNGQGIGTSAFSKWAENCERLVANDPSENARINQLVESLFEKMNEVSGPFFNNEGSGLYELHSCINHSCEPNAEVCFPHNNFILALKALENIQPGEEIYICYLDECWKNRSHHSRNKYLRENYLFICKCTKCQRQINDPDITSEESEESNSDLHSNSDDNEGMNCD